VSTGFPDEPGSGEPGLDQLLRALTAKGYPRELAGRDAALAAFRAARSQPRRRPRFPVLPGAPARLTAAAAALIVALAGFTAAAYAQALPGPMQHIAYSVLAPIGVPDSQPASGGNPPPAPKPASGPAAARGHGTHSPPAAAHCPCPAQPSRPARKGSVLAITAARDQLPADGWDTFAGKLTYRGQPEAGVRLRLLERPAGAAGWHQVGTGVTGSRGGVRIGIPHLTRNAIFRLAGPNGVRSPTIAVTVNPRVLLWRAPAQPGTDRLVSAARFGDPGDVVTLQELSGGSWQIVAAKVLDATRRAAFHLQAAAAAGHSYRAVLQATSTHGTGVSAPVFEPPVNAAIGARAIQPDPQPPSPGLPSPGGHRSRLPGPVRPDPVLPGPVTPGPGTPSPLKP